MPGNSDSFEFSVELDDLDEPSNGNGQSAPQQVARHGQSASGREGLSKSELLEAELLETLRPPPSAENWSKPRTHTSTPPLGTVGDDYGAPARQSDDRLSGDYSDRHSREPKPPRPVASSHRWDDVTPRNSSSDLLAPTNSSSELQVPSQPMVVASFVVHPKPGVAPISFPSWSDSVEPISSSDFDSPPRHGRESRAPESQPFNRYGAQSGATPHAAVPSSWPVPRHNAHAQSLPFPQSLDVPSTDPTGGKPVDGRDSERRNLARRDTRPPRLSTSALGSVETAPPITTRGTHRAGPPSSRRGVRPGLIAGVLAAFLGPFLVASVFSSWLNGNLGVVSQSANASSVAPTSVIHGADQATARTVAPPPAALSNVSPAALEIQDLDVLPQTKSSTVAAPTGASTERNGVDPLVPKVVSVKATSVTSPASVSTSARAPAPGVSQTTNGLTAFEVPSTNSAPVPPAPKGKSALDSDAVSAAKQPGTSQTQPASRASSLPAEAALPGVGAPVANSVSDQLPKPRFGSSLLKGATTPGDGTYRVKVPAESAPSP